MPTTERVIFSGVQPTGQLTLGNYLGALRRFAELQHEARCLFCVVNLHALTMPHSPSELRARTREVAALFLACGIDPKASVVFRQGDVAAHTTLTYLLESTAHVGELNRMIQFKEKGRDQPGTRASLYTYPVLMAADILVYGAGEVPVGEDQRQHLELARTVAERFNNTYGEVFVRPRMLDATVAARVMDLQDPMAKMSKNSPVDGMGAVRLLDEPDVVRRKFLRAVTDSGNQVRHAPEEQPGIANLVEILAAATGQADPATVAAGYSSYGALKRDAAEAVIELLNPVGKRYADITADPAELDRILDDGADRAAALAEPYVAASRRAIGVD